MSTQVIYKSEQPVDEAMAKAVAEALISRSKRGDINAAREVMDRVEGKVTTKVEQEIGHYNIPDPFELMRKYVDKSAKGSAGGNGRRKPATTPRSN